MAIKMGIATWMFTEPAHNPPYEEAIKTIGELGGFDGVELILRDPQDVDGYWTPATRREIGSMLDGYGLAVSEFVLYQNIVGGLASLDKTEKQTSLDLFERGCEIAVDMGTDSLNIVSPWAAGLDSPMPYLPEYIYPGANGCGKRLSAKYGLSIPDDFNWDAHWENYLQSIRKANDICKKYGLRFIIENHAHVMTGHTDSLLRLFDHIPDDNIGVNMDISWTYIQREDVPLAIYKLGKKLWHIHARDGDGLSCYMLPVGEGTLNWENIIRALKRVGFDGYFSLEWAHVDNSEKWAKESQLYVKKLIDTIEP